MPSSAASPARPSWPPASWCCSSWPGSAFRFLQVHNAENGVSNLKSSVAQLNAQIPTFDKVVAITNELRVAKGEVSQISAKAVDWSAVVAQLQQRIPAGLAVTTFTGTSTASGGAATAGAAATATTAVRPQRGHGACRGHRLAHPGGLGGVPELRALRSRGAVDRRPHGIVHVQPARRGLGHQCSPIGANTTVAFQSTLWLTHELQPDQERRFVMEQLTRYRIPILTAVGALVVAIVVYAAWISPEGGKLSSLHAQQTQLQSQQTHLQTELAALRSDKAHLAANCQQLTTDLTEIPGTPTVDAFFHQVTALAVAAGDPNTPEHQRHPGRGRDRRREARRPST